MANASNIRDFLGRDVRVTGRHAGAGYQYDATLVNVNRVSLPDGKETESVELLLLNKNATKTETVWVPTGKRLAVFLPLTSVTNVCALNDDSTWSAVAEKVEAEAKPAAAPPPAPAKQPKPRTKHVAPTRYAEAPPHAREKAAKDLAEVDLDNAILAFANRARDLGFGAKCRTEHDVYSRVYTIRFKNELLARPASDKPVGDLAEWKAATENLQGLLREWQDREAARANGERVARMAAPAEEDDDFAPVAVAGEEDRYAIARL